MTKEEENIAEFIIRELDEIGRNHDNYDYGLPTHNSELMESMTEKVGEGFKMLRESLEIKEREHQEKMRELRSCLDICKIYHEQSGNAIALKAFETAIKHVDILIPKKG